MQECGRSCQQAPTNGLNMTSYFRDQLALNTLDDIAPDESDVTPYFSERFGNESGGNAQACSDEQ